MRNADSDCSVGVLLLVSTECMGLLLNGAAEEAIVSDLSRGQMAAQRGVQPLETIMSPLLFDLVQSTCDEWCYALSWRGALGARGVSAELTALR